MKKISLILIVLAVCFSLGCSVNPSKISIDSEDFSDAVTYVKDIRTGLCFAIMASRESFKWSSSGLGISVVPCDRVRSYLK